jgi:hypothetical protein
MEVRTEIKDIRVSYKGLNEIAEYLRRPENEGAIVSRTEYHPSEVGQRDYFLVDVSIPQQRGPEYVDRITSNILMGIRRNDPEFSRILNIPISHLDLSVRTANCLYGAGIETAGELAKQTEQGLLQIRGFGKACLNDIKHKLREFGLTLGMELEPIDSETTGNQ